MLEGGAAIAGAQLDHVASVLEIYDFRHELRLLPRRLRRPRRRPSPARKMRPGAAARARRGPGGSPRRPSSETAPLDAGIGSRTPPRRRRVSQRRLVLEQARKSGWRTLSRVRRRPSTRALLNRGTPASSRAKSSRADRQQRLQGLLAVVQPACVSAPTAPTAGSPTTTRQRRERNRHDPGLG